LHFSETDLSVLGEQELIHLLIKIPISGSPPCHLVLAIATELPLEPFTLLLSGVLLLKLAVKLLRGVQEKSTNQPITVASGVLLGDNHFHLSAFQLQDTWTLPLANTTPSP
jgi:hypothetical protein